jgi:hypothetical protein
LQRKALAILAKRGLRAKARHRALEFWTMLTVPDEQAVEAIGVLSSARMKAFIRPA